MAKRSFGGHIRSIPFRVRVARVQELIVKQRKTALAEESYLEPIHSQHPFEVEDETLSSGDDTVDGDRRLHTTGGVACTRHGRGYLSPGDDIRIDNPYRAVNEYKTFQGELASLTLRESGHEVPCTENEPDFLEECNELTEDHNSADFLTPPNEHVIAEDAYASASDDLAETLAQHAEERRKAQATKKDLEKLMANRAAMTMT